MKKLMSLVLAMIMCVGLSVSAFALEPKQEELASREVDLYNKELYKQELLSVTPAMENGVQVGTIREYRFTPVTQPRGPMNYVTYMAEHQASNGNEYARLYGYFMYDGETVTCYDSSLVVCCNNFIEKERKIGTNIWGHATVKSELTYMSSHGGAAPKSLSLWCDKNGNHG